LGALLLYFGLFRNFPSRYNTMVTVFFDFCNFVLNGADFLEVPTSSSAFRDNIEYEIRFHSGNQRELLSQNLFCT